MAQIRGDSNGVGAKGQVLGRFTFPDRLDAKCDNSVGFH